ncbi:ABC transporter ATP-binding protein [Streptomyces gobiensis]|uniref:ABC transporter ATP-binding protein n=1 Tax=Streptomyces gobiensis TaxID=2875706 RepID=UPI001E48664C|nr:ABC transporter ATP-binding protein [Streptomyces gobiensis]UGY91133.1 ABC transporter ATP-binding protein/permease [Streptomyces gobiensis]
MAAPAADRILLDATRHSAVRTIALCLTTTAAAVATLLLPATLGHALDLLLAQGAPQEAQTNPTPSPNPDTSTTYWITLCALLLGALFLLDAVETVLTGTTNARNTAWLRGRLLDRVLAIGPAGAARFTQGDLVTRCTGNAAHAGTAPTAAAALLAALVTPIGGVAALALIDLRLAAAFLVGAPVLILLLRTFARSSADSVARYQEAQGTIAGRLSEALAGARTVAAAGTYERERTRILGPLTELSEQGHRVWRVLGRATAQAAALVPLLQTAVIAVGGLLLVAGQLTVGELVAAARYAVLATGVGVLVGHLNGLICSRGAARRLADVHSVPAVPYGTRALPAGPGRLELRGVTAVRGGRTVLRGVDLTVPGGSTVAVVGRSGSGKSELARLAGKLTQPDGGEVLMDGVPVDRIDRAELRRAIGYAFERPALLGGTIGGTIGFGPADPGPRRIAAAARAACAEGFIRTLPAGYDTRCADAPLSGGEAQRLGLARVFAHDGRLLILDDATSSLDTATELQVSEALLGGERSRTKLVVAHRASTAARADLVAWLDEGRIRAVAPHNRLWELPGYRAVFGEDEDG